MFNVGLNGFKLMMTRRLPSLEVGSASTWAPLHAVVEDQLSSRLGREQRSEVGPRLI
jgi:hypothetical protein